MNQRPIRTRSCRTDDLKDGTKLTTREQVCKQRRSEIVEDSCTLHPPPRYDDGPDRGSQCARSIARQYISFERRCDSLSALGGTVEVAASRHLDSGYGDVERP